MVRILKNAGMASVTMLAVLVAGSVGMRAWGNPCNNQMEMYLDNVEPGVGCVRLCQSCCSHTLYSPPCSYCTATDAGYWCLYDESYTSKVQEYVYGDCVTNDPMGGPPYFCWGGLPLGPAKYRTCYYTGGDSCQ